VLARKTQILEISSATRWRDGGSLLPIHLQELVEVIDHEIFKPTLIIVFVPSGGRVARRLSLD
jgi:hypothetical protein